MSKSEILKKLSIIREALVENIEHADIYPTALRDCDDLIKEFTKKREVPE